VAPGSIRAGFENAVAIAGLDGFLFHRPRGQRSARFASGRDRFHSVQDSLRSRDTRCSARQHERDIGQREGLSTAEQGPILSKEVET